MVSGSEAQLGAISEALWADRPGDFLANGMAGTAHDARQPILLSQTMEAANGARMVMFADGTWREGADRFDRAMLLFDDGGIEGARACWRMLGESEAVERRFWKQEDGRWREGP